MFGLEMGEGLCEEFPTLLLLLSRGILGIGSNIDMRDYLGHRT